MGGPRAVETFRGRFGYAIPMTQRDSGYGSGPLTAVMAPRLNRDALWQALTTGRTYATTGARILILNEYEYNILRKKTGLDQNRLLERVECIIITKGKKGSTIMSRDVPPLDVPAAQPNAAYDPTGVGDAYRAGLIKGLVRGYPWEVTGRLASLAAIYVLEHPGPQPQPYTRREFAQRYRQNFGDAPQLADFLTNDS